jgi:hypothetical protein
MNDALDAICRSKAGKGDEWSPYSFTVVPPPPQPFAGVQVVGSNHRLVTRGPGKGQRRWTSEGKVTIFLTADEYNSCFPSK